MEHFLNDISSFSPLEQAAVEEFRQRLEYLSVLAKNVLLREGEVAQKMFFVRKGCLRLYFYNAGNDITFQFFFEGSVMASFGSWHKRQPSQFSLESIEPTELVAVPREAFDTLIHAVLSLRDRYEEVLIERFHAYQQLFFSRIKNTPQQRYEELLRERPNVLLRVPQHYIASFLGITPVSLSRIRNRR